MLIYREIKKPNQPSEKKKKEKVGEFVNSIPGQPNRNQK